MLLFLTVLQMITLFCTHLLMTRTAASILLMLFILAITSVGGYAIHIGEIPYYLWWGETFSPQRWLLPIIINDEFSPETLANTAGQQLCRNKHVITFFNKSFLSAFYSVSKFIFFSFRFRYNDKKSLYSIHVQCRMVQKF